MESEEVEDLDEKAASKRLGKFLASIKVKKKKKRRKDEKYPPFKLGTEHREENLMNLGNNRLTTYKYTAWNFLPKVSSVFAFFFFSFVFFFCVFFFSLSSLTCVCWCRISSSSSARLPTFTF